MSDRMNPPDRRTRAERERLSIVRAAHEVHEEEGKEMDLVNARVPRSPKCEVCQLPNRKLPYGAYITDELIFTKAVRGYSIKNIHQEVLDLTKGLWPDEELMSYEQIRTHVRNHISWEVEAARKRAEAEALARGEVIEERTGLVIGIEQGVKEWADQVLELIMAREMAPDPKTALSVLKLAWDLDQNAKGSFSTLRYRMLFERIGEFLVERLPPEVYAELISDVSQLETMGYTPTDQMPTPALEPTVEPNDG